MIMQQVQIQDNGHEYVKTWSDSEFLIMNANGDLFVEAIDPIEFNRSYTETKISIHQSDEDDEMNKKQL